MKVFYVPSRSEKNVKRQVIQDDKGYWHCDCRFFGIKHITCFHIKEAQKNEKN